MMRRSLTFAVTTFLTFALLWAVGWVWFTLSIASMTKIENPQKTDAIVVLTGGKNRIKTGLDLLQDRHSRHLLISGVNKNFKEKDLIDQWGGNKKVLPCCISLGYEARDTIGNAHETKAWAKKQKIQSLTLVTSNYHITRSMLIFKTFMPGITMHAYPVMPEDTQPWSTDFWMRTFKEYNKTMVTWIELQIAKDYVS